MHKILSVAQMRAADEYTINTLGVSSKELMRRAGTAIAEEVAAEVAAGDEVLVVCGSGNNGGDGYVCAQELLRRGFRVKVYACGGNLSPDCLRERSRYSGRFSDEIKGDIIVDCIFGTGLCRTVSGGYADVINKINSSGAYVVAADIPSGMSGDGGVPLGVCVRADKTVAIGELKYGFALSDGFDLCGKVVRRDIGITLPEGEYACIYGDDDIKKFFPKRPRNSHKGTFGTATVMCGSPQYIGSAVLAVSAALVSGCGYVKAVCPDEVREAIASGYPQTVFSPQCDLNSKAVAIGMGCGASQALHSDIEWLLKEFEGTLIIDADGINSLAGYGVGILRNKKCSVVLTPHIKEFSRIAAMNTQQILADPVGSAEKFAREYGVTIALKGAGTIISDGIHTALNTRGCSALAKAGSGDMLAGFMCGTIARGLTAFEGAVCAAYVLGAASELAAGKLTEYCVTHRDILKNIPAAIKNIIA